MVVESVETAAGLLAGLKAVWKVVAKDDNSAGRSADRRAVVWVDTLVE